MQRGMWICTLAKSIRRLDDVMEGADEIELGLARHIPKKQRFHSGRPGKRVNGVARTLGTTYYSLWYFRRTYRFALDKFGRAKNSSLVSLASLTVRVVVVAETREYQMVP